MARYIKKKEKKILLESENEIILKNVNNIKSQDKKISQKNRSDIQVKKLKDKIVLYILTRDFRTEDNLTLYKAFDEAKKYDCSLCIVFRFHPDQIIQERNPFYCSHAVQFMIESLEQFSNEVNINFIDPIEDDNWEIFLKSLPIHKIFIMRDFSPFARKRYEFLSKIASTEEVDDVTVYPINEIGVFNKLAYFINHVKTHKFREPEKREVDWKGETQYFDLFVKENFIHRGKINIHYKNNNTLMVHPRDLEKTLSKLVENVKGYSIKKIREQVGSPKVTTLSAFIKFGMISIRTVHALVRNTKGISNEDKSAFERELYFRDFFYKLASAKPNDVFDKPNWQGNQPKFTSEEDLLEFKRQRGMKQVVSKDEFKEIEEARQIYAKFENAETEYPLINASIMQLKTTGYMLNRTRMLVASYLSQDHQLWWKYAEKFFANYLTEYDWTINSLSHQNIAKVGVYPKYTLNFSIKRQESMNPKDKEKYINQYLKRKK
jgi:deoxyribodipyrimidine photo-lyase